MGRRWPAVTDTAELRLRPFDDVRWDAEVDFVFEEGLQFGLLGYEGFLNRWAVSFDGYHGYFIVEAVDEFHDRQHAELFSEFRDRWPNI
jgi:hypothetical protein